MRFKGKNLYLLITVAGLVMGCSAMNTDTTEDVNTEVSIENIDNNNNQDADTNTDDLGTKEADTSEQSAENPDSDISDTNSSETEASDIKDSDVLDTGNDESSSEDTETNIIEALDINFHATDDKGKTYSFTYNGEEFKAEYTPDNWRIYNSYKITDSKDMAVICQALIDEHPVHGKDMESYRVASDMVDEWLIHNMAYKFLEDDNPLKKRAGDVDFDPKDQGKTFEEFYKDKTGKEFNAKEILKKYKNQ